MSALQAARMSGNAPAITTTVSVAIPPSALDKPKESKDYPIVLKNYVDKVIAYGAANPTKRSLIQKKLANLVTRAKEDNSIWTTDWDRMPLPK